MISVNGTPQFEINELLSMTVTANEKLREWASNRNCAHCANLETEVPGWSYCWGPLREYTDRINVTDFYCSDFEAKK